MHHQGTCLSQAFARKWCADPSGAVICIDFEDDPRRVTLAVVYARCAVLRALHRRSPAPSGTLTEGRALGGVGGGGSAEMREVLATSVQRMGWMRHLPTNRKLGRDLQRWAAYDLLA